MEQTTEQTTEQLSEQAKSTTPVNISDLLPLGYLYLLVLGIASDSIYYSFLGINIISYSTILDVLLSPVSQIADNYKVFLMIVILPAFAYVYILMMQKLASRKKTTQTKPNFMTAYSPFQIWFTFTAYLILSGYIGLGIGKGSRISERMANGELDPKETLTFQDGKSLKVRIIGNNSSYIFYVAQGTKSVTIVPIQDNIVKIETIEKEDK